MGRSRLLRRHRPPAVRHGSPGRGRVPRHVRRSRSRRPPRGTAPDRGEGPREEPRRTVDQPARQRRSARGSSPPRRPTYSPAGAGPGATRADHLVTGEWNVPGVEDPAWRTPAASTRKRALMAAVAAAAAGTAVAGSIVAFDTKDRVVTGTAPSSAVSASPLHGASAATDSSSIPAEAMTATPVDARTVRVPTDPLAGVPDPAYTRSGDETQPHPDEWRTSATMRQSSGAGGRAVDPRPDDIHAGHEGHGLHEAHGHVQPARADPDRDRRAGPPTPRPLPGSVPPGRADGRVHRARTPPQERPHDLAVRPLLGLLEDIRR